MPSQERNSKILGALGDQSEAILRLEKMIENLLTRLNPILKQAPTPELSPEEKEGLEVASELYLIIKANRMKIESVTGQIENVLTNLDL